MAVNDLPSPRLPRLVKRCPDSHKGTYGSALIIGGSRGMAGAVSLTGMSALRSGAGTVRLGVPDQCLNTVAGFSPSLMTQPLDNDREGRLATGAARQLSAWLNRATCVAIGPGLGQSAELQQLLLDLLPQLQCPVVIDADGLNNLSGSIEGDDFRWRKRLAAPLIITPHPGEWSRLSGVAVDSAEEQSAAAIRLAAEHDVVIVLKGHRTLITDGVTAVRNATGSPAMAIGGSGDVLTGVITALVCQGLAPRDAAHLAVHVHGRAGEIAAEEQGSHVVLPTELIDFLPRAFALAGSE